MKPVFAGLLTVALFGCRDDIGTGPDLAPLQFISGNLATDTIQAILSRPLIVAVRDSTKTLVPAGTRVRFTMIGETLAFSNSGAYFALVQGPADPYFKRVTETTTDASGRTAVRVRLGMQAGTVRILVEVPTLGYTDTAQFTVKPGTGVGIGVAPADTAIYVGTSYQLRGGFTDRFGNVRTFPVTWIASGIDVSATGVVTSSTIGRFTVVGNVQGSMVSASLSVVPQGRLAALRGTTIVTLGLDGSDYKAITTSTISSHWAWQWIPRWIPNTDNILYVRDSLFLRLFLTDLAGNTRRFLDPTPNTVLDQLEAMPDRTGTWVYFGASNTECPPRIISCLYRAAADGSGTHLFNGRRQQMGTALSPTPSPDGSKVAFVTEEIETGTYSLIRILDVASNTIQGSPTYGVSPSWSPDGSRIAYLSSFDGSLMVMNVDGTQSRRVVPLPKAYSRQPLTWSPNSQWLLLRGENSLEIVNVQTGMVLPIPNSSEITGADWR